MKVEGTEVSSGWHWRQWAALLCIESAQDEDWAHLMHSYAAWMAEHLRATPVKDGLLVELSFFISREGAAYVIP